MKTSASIIFILFFAAFTGFAQDYNFSFENWLDHGTFEEPEYWGTFNAVAIVGVQAHKDTDAMHGNYSLKLATQSIPAGVAVLGIINPSSGLIKPGRPFTHRPEKVTCWYRTKLVNGDSSAIVFTLTKYDHAGDSVIRVGFAGMLFYSDVPEWTLLELPFEYYSNETPDSLGVILSATANPDGFGNAGCELSVDGIQFQFFTSAGNALTDERDFRMYPNPVNEWIFISSNRPFENGNIYIHDLTGREIYSSLFASDRHVVDTRYFPKGIYHVIISSSGERKSIGSFIRE